MGEVTHIMNAVGQRDDRAAAQPLLNDELRRLAAARMVCEKPE
jgi:hypothetical protein